MQLTTTKCWLVSFLHHRCSSQRSGRVPQRVKCPQLSQSVLSCPLRLHLLPLVLARAQLLVKIVPALHTHLQRITRIPSFPERTSSSINMVPNFTPTVETKHHILTLTTENPSRCKRFLSSTAVIQSHHPLNLSIKVVYRPRSHPGSSEAY